MKKTVAILSAVIAFAVSSTAFVGYASPEIPEDATVKTLDTALANPSQWTFNEGTTAAVSDGKLSLNQAVGTAYANPNSNLSATELTQFKWTPIGSGRKHSVYSTLHNAGQCSGFGQDTSGFCFSTR